MRKAPTTIPRRQLGRQLRELRLQAGMSIVDAARHIERGAGTLQRLEKGETPRIRLLDIKALCELFDAPEKLDGLLELARVAAGSDGENGLWWDEFGLEIRTDFHLYLSLETAAEKLTIYRPDIIPGLLQIPAYARVLESDFNPEYTSEDLDRTVRIRVNRQRNFTRKRNPVEVLLIVDEGVLRRVVGDRRVMAKQLRYLADLPPNVTVQVLPFARGYPLGGVCGPFVVLDFDNAVSEPPTVFVEGYRGNMYYDLPAAVEQYRRAARALQGASLSPADSKRFLRDLAREHDGGR
ncbi:helix-turn-helix domain-containing protein [Nocardia cyriacigeorgica]|uniref:Helix-turn-helix domain-containing protein n=1 Tax=Nocardia cyriacigeorgica TaxID=135487 RepID=A0A5R8PII9_9NOCA|nr:helix-turn-helix transcriptional regulator [Nocardia cyriacigeorgica]TLG16363.1 helix-turn-helix domain-containing protein [Nocardia cyriacigeorgica]